jgi:hypothetical protein
MEVLMKATAKWIGWTFALLLAVPVTSFPQGRWDPWVRDDHYRRDNREAIYRDGYNDGCRDGMRQGNYDMRLRRHPSYRTPEYNHPDEYRGRYESRFQGDYRKGYKNGYRDGYNNAFRGNRGGRWPF